MQTTNTNQTGSKGVQASSRSSTAVKSFTDLKGALIEKEIDSFVEQVNKGIDAWRKAGQILVELSRRQPDIFRLIQARHPSISESVLQTFARIGREEIWPPLLVDASLGARKLLECSYAEQKEYAEKPIKVAIAWDGKTIKTKDVKVQELTKQECAVVFSEGSINTLDQQAWRLRGGTHPGNNQPDSPSQVYVAPRLTNVDIGYFSLVIQPDGTIKCEPCGKSTVAQPVRVLSNGQGYRSAVVVLYKQEMK